MAGWRRLAALDPSAPAGRDGVVSWCTDTLYHRLRLELVVAELSLAQPDTSAALNALIVASSSKGGVVESNRRPDAVEQGLDVSDRCLIDARPTELPRLVALGRRKNSKLKTLTVSLRKFEAGTSRCVLQFLQKRRASALINMKISIDLAANWRLEPPAQQADYPRTDGLAHVLGIGVGPPRHLLDGDSTAIPPIDVDAIKIVVADPPRSVTPKS
jgi:hypothetical protein